MAGNGAENRISANDGAPKSVPLPLSSDELFAQFGTRTPDFVLITGDAYIDHPSFGTAIIARLLASRGYSVGIIAQPDWKKPDSVKRFGRPRLGFLVNSGNMDSMVNHYTVAKKLRGGDAYTPGGRRGARPDRAVNVYCRLVRSSYGDVPIIIGGIEASLRRFAHYDYWSDRVLPSVLLSSGANLLVYGMGEKQILAAAEALDGGLDIHDVTYINGTAYLADDLNRVYEYELIDGFEAVSKDKKAYCAAFMEEYREQDAVCGKRLVQPHGERFLVVNPPAEPLTTDELDEVYELPYTRLPHPDYREHIPALDEIRFSLTSCRGCFGQCSFCALTFHQGRVIQARSHASLLREARLLTKLDGFKGYIHDVGGPTANFRFPACKKQLTKGVCHDKACLGYSPCKSVVADHGDYVELLKKLRNIDGVKKVFIRSGIRYDYLMYDKNDAFFRELINHHVSGQLKVAPEHIDDRVLEYMNKPGGGLYERFVQKYEALNRRFGMDQYIVPYFMSSHPGSTLDSAVALAEYLKRSGQRPEQVQDFYPTPGTLSTCMFYTGLDPRTMKPVYIPRSPSEKAMQRALMQFFIPKNRPLVREALRAADRDDLIGYGKNCLVPPERGEPFDSDGRRRTGGARSINGAKKQKPREKAASTAKPTKHKKASSGSPQRAKKQTGSRGRSNSGAGKR